MSKPDKFKNKAGIQESNRVIQKRTFFIAFGVFVIIATLAVAAFVLLAPGASQSSSQNPAVQPVVSGTGTGSEAAAGDSVSYTIQGCSRTERSLISRPAEPQ